MADETQFLQPLVRPDFKPEIFDTAIRQKGYKVVWEQGMLCSCYPDDVSGQPDYNCPHCKGKGYIYFNARETRVVATSINGHKEQERIGLTDFGTAYMTPLSTDNVGFRDRFTFVDFTIKFSQLVKRGYVSGGDELRYPCQDMVCLRKGDTVYKNGVDFKISKDGRKVEWLGELLFEGEQYSVLYMTAPVYIAINPVHELRGTYTMLNNGGLEQFVQLPKQFQIKREDFL